MANGWFGLKSRGVSGGDGAGRGVFLLILWRLGDFPVVSSLLVCRQQSVLSRVFKDMEVCISEMESMRTHGK